MDTPDYELADRARQAALRLQEHLRCHDRAGQARELTKLGNLAMIAADYAGALEYLHEAEDLARALGDVGLLRDVTGQLGAVHLERGDLVSARDWAERIVRMTGEHDDARAQMLALNGLGCVLAKAGQHVQGIAALHEAHGWVDRLTDLSTERQAHYRAQSLADLSEAHLGAGDASQALAYALQSEVIARSNGNLLMLQLALRYKALAVLATGDAALALAGLDEALGMAQGMGLKGQQGMLQGERSQVLEQLGRFEEALAALRACQRISGQAKLEEAARLTEFRRIGADIALARLDAQAAQRLLFAVLPEPIARRIEAGETRIADELPDVSVLFADLVGFTQMASALAPADLLAHLDTIFSRFDALAVAAGLEKVKTIGDAYMVIGGAPTPRPDHLRRMVQLGLSMLEEVSRIRHATGLDLRMRIGLHAGPVIAGVIGSERLSYDLWGETVNFASRLESAGVPGGLHVCADIAQRLVPGFAWQPRGVIVLKGLGEVPTCLLMAPGEPAP